MYHMPVRRLGFRGGGGSNFYSFQKFERHRPRDIIISGIVLSRVLNKDSISFADLTRTKEMRQWAEKESLSGSVINMLEKEEFDLESLTYLSEDDIRELRRQYQIGMGAIIKLNKSISNLKDPKD